VLEGDELQAWGADDAYIDDIVKKEMETINSAS
jgi:hypothetical protein